MTKGRPKKFETTLSATEREALQQIAQSRSMPHGVVRRTQMILLSQHGAVSAECAVAMATGVAEQLDADFGVAITGFAGPAGGNGENPVGTIYVGMHAPGGDWSRKLTYPGPRGAVKQRAVTAAIDWLRREIMREARKVAVSLAN